MLEKPDISNDSIIACLHDTFGLRIAHVAFLPLGWVHNATYRVTAQNGTPYFLKLRRGNFNEIAVAVPAFLHAQGIRQVMAPVATTSHDLWIHAHGFDWILYPFFEGKTGFEVALSKTHWTWFYHGYGQTEIDLLAFSYYRYERIVVDIAEISERIFGMHGSVEERRKELGLVNQFLPNNVVDIAHRTYQQLA